MNYLIRNLPLMFLVPRTKSFARVGLVSGCRIRGKIIKTEHISYSTSSDTSTSSLPPQIQSDFSLIKELRSSRSAIVDKMGASALHDKSPHNKNAAFQTLICLMLSAQTRDTVVSEVMIRLRRNGLSIQRILSLSQDDLAELIHPVGFKNRKARFILETCVMLNLKHNGQVPDSMEELLLLPGVGPKMAILAMHIIFGKVEGISVDTHVHRIAKQLLWVDPSTAKTPLHTMKQLEILLPKDLWGEVNILLVGLGQDVQNDPNKLFDNCWHCSRPEEALVLIHKLGVDVSNLLKTAKAVKK